MNPKISRNTSHGAASFEIRNFWLRKLSRGLAALGLLIFPVFEAADAEPQGNANGGCGEEQDPDGGNPVGLME